MEDKLKSGKRLIVIGGGAAGFFCAVNAARLAPGLEVFIIEKSNKLLSKVKVSGGGRCNITHACFDIDEMSRHYPRGKNFVKKTFYSFFTSDTIKWFEDRGTNLKTENDGRIFPVTDSSQTVIDCLLKEAMRYDVSIYMGSEVKNVKKKNGQFLVGLTAGKQLSADFVCIASGGYPKYSMFEWIKSLGHTIEEPVPSLFTFNLPGNPVTRLMGISAEKIKVKIAGTKLEEEGPMLITHWGFSGPVILRLSAWGARYLAGCNWQFTILINWLPAYNDQSLKEEFQQLRSLSPSQKVFNRNTFLLPLRLWQFLAELSGIHNEWRWADVPIAEQNRFIKNLCQYECVVKGKTTFKEEFVTAGGINLSEVDHNTMMSKKIANLFFVGEVLDVDAITGGFNFQHAWTSGFVAATSIAGIASANT